MQTWESSTNRFPSCGFLYKTMVRCMSYMQKEMVITSIQSYMGKV